MSIPSIVKRTGGRENAWRIDAILSQPQDGGTVPGKNEGDNDRDQPQKPFQVSSNFLSKDSLRFLHAERNLNFGTTNERFHLSHFVFISIHLIWRNVTKNIITSIDVSISDCNITPSRKRSAIDPTSIW